MLARVRRSGVLTLFYSAPCRHKNLALLFVLVEENTLSSVVSPGSLPGEFASGVFRVVLSFLFNLISPC